MAMEIDRNGGFVAVNMVGLNHSYVAVYQRVVVVKFLLDGMAFPLTAWIFSTDSTGGPK